VGAIQPLLCERSVLRLSDERALKKVAHWQAVAISACEQSGRTRVPLIAAVRTLTDWLHQPAEDGVARWVLSLGEAVSMQTAEVPSAGVVCLSGPEGGLSPAEDAAARRAGFAAVSLGPRVLRADTAPLAVLAVLALRGSGG
jgi:16S rRNA (uracil1498-N3)-methyltransferase